MTRRPYLIAVCGIAAIGLLPGCAQPKARQSTSPPPTSEELPTFTYAERVLPARVGVEGWQSRPREMLVPSFKPQPLTAEEQAALAATEDKPLFDWLEFYVPVPRVLLVTPDFGGVSTGVSESGGVLVGWDIARSAAGIGARSASVQGVHHDRDERFSAAGGPRNVVGRSEDGGVRVGVDIPRTASGHSTQIDD